jgi:O-antigen/teichoic acid export membrane protein
MKRRTPPAAIATARFSRHQEFLGHVAALMSGKAIAGLIALVTMPVVSRLFTPEHFGVAALFVSVISMMGAVATLNYDAAVVLPDDDEDAFLLMALAYRILAAVSGLVLIVIAGYEITGIAWATLELLGGWKWLLPVGLLLLVGVRIQESWLARTKNFKLMAGSLVAGNASTGISRIIMGLFGGSSVFGLITGYLLGVVIRIGVQWSACGSVLKRSFRRVPAARLREIGRRYADFPFYNAPARMVFTLGQNLPILLFGIMFSPAVAGFFAMARQLLSAPIGMVADSFRRVFMQKAASIRNEGRSLRKAYILSTGALSLIGLPVLLVLWNFGQPLATWFLGERWLEAGRYIEIASPWFFMIFVMASCKSVYVVLRKQRLFLTVQIVHTVFRISAFGVAWLMSFSPEETLQGFVLMTVLGNLVTMSVAFSLIKSHASSLAGEARAKVAQDGRGRDVGDD